MIWRRPESPGFACRSGGASLRAQGWVEMVSLLMRTSVRGRSPAPLGMLVGDPVDDVLPGDHLAEDGVAVVEPGRRHHGDEELAAVGVGAGVGHGQQARLVELAAALELVLELVARAAGAATERVAALDHEVRDAAVEDGPVVERRRRSSSRRWRGAVHSFSPVASPTKFSTVFGASLANSFTTTLPSVVSKCVQVLAGLHLVHHCPSCGSSSVASRGHLFWLRGGLVRHLGDSTTSVVTGSVRPVAHHGLSPGRSSPPRRSPSPPRRRWCAGRSGGRAWRW